LLELLLRRQKALTACLCATQQVRLCLTRSPLLADSQALVAAALLVPQDGLALQVPVVTVETALSLAELAIPRPLAAAVQVAVAPTRVAQAARVES
jgi:hypothetical protein